MESLENSPEKSNILYRKTTLGELGNHLPVYRSLYNHAKPDERTIIPSNEFTFHPWDMEMEELLSVRMEKTKGVGSFINEMMCLLLDQFCGGDFQSLKPEQRTLTMNQLDWPNMMYMYVYLRVEELGSELSLNLICPNARCGKSIENYVVDLNDLDIHVKEYDFENNKPIHPRIATYELVKPIILPDNQIITAFDFDVSKWDYMERSDKKDGENAARIKQLMLKSSIAGFKNGDKKIEKFLDPNSVFKYMKKVDIEKSIRLVMENNAGIVAAVSGNCPFCETSWNKVLDWSYKSFFDSSSL